MRHKIAILILPLLLIFQLSSFGQSCFSVDWYWDCPSQSATATVHPPFGGNPPYTYLWDNGSTNQSTNLQPGDHTVTVTSAAGCSDVLCLTVEKGCCLFSDWDATSDDCGPNPTGTAKILDVQGGSGIYHYEWFRVEADGTWTPLNFFGTTKNNLFGGNYVVVITDITDDCFLEQWIEVPTDPVPTGYFLFTNETCSDTNGVLTIVPLNGTSPYTYAWSNGANTATIDSLPAGNYSVTVTDKKFCSFTKTFPLTNIGLPAVVKVDTASCSPIPLPWGDTAFTSTTYVWFDSTDCGTMYEWDVTIAPTVEKVLWDTLCSGSAIVFGGQICDTTGTFSFSDTTSNGCPRNWTLHLTVLDSVENVIVHKTSCVAKNDEVFHLITSFGCPYDSIVVYDVQPEQWVWDTLLVCDPYQLPIMVSDTSVEGCVTHTTYVPKYVGKPDTVVWLEDCKFHYDSLVLEILDYPPYCSREVLYKWHVEDLDMVYKQEFSCKDSLAYTYSDSVAYTSSNCPYTIRTWIFPTPIELVTLPDTLVCFNSALVGPIVDTVLNTDGCKVMRVMNVQKLPQPIGHEVITLCIGETLVRNGVQISEPGVYTALSGLSVFGCDSSTVMHVTYVGGNFFSQTKDTCIADLDPVVTFTTSPNGCVDTVVTNWTFKPNFGSVTEFSCSGPVGDTTYMLIDATGCVTEMLCHRFLYEPVDSFETKQVCPTEFPFAWNGDTITGSGKYSAILENASIHGCDITVNLTVYEQPLAIQTDSVSVCEDEDFYYAEQDTFLSTGVHDFFSDCSVNRVVVSNYVDQISVSVPPDLVLIDSAGMSLNQIEGWVIGLASGDWVSSLHDGKFTLVSENVSFVSLDDTMATYIQTWDVKTPCGDTSISRNIKVLFPLKPELPESCRFRIYPNPSSVNDPVTMEVEGFYGNLEVTISGSSGAVESKSVRLVNGYNENFQLNLPQRAGVWFVHIKDAKHDFVVRATRH